ncbi:helix-turn-helix domain-containing protein [Leptospira yasudae]|uniref:Transcriptional regulator n=1 Tax=Leptospira yasudae TaxID=2202201 RepID=A0ABX9LX85_9LEPT|nr:helix-turn-helix transcriptional regulator [Leptospira yasudae]RHX77479.1 transcriptional regulator [Leptospira yasudae]
MDYTEFRKSVSERIKAIRVEKKLSQEWVSGIEMSVRSYQKIESGESAPSLESLFIISKAFEMHPKDLLNVQIKLEDKTKKRK